MTNEDLLLKELHDVEIEIAGLAAAQSEKRRRIARLEAARDEVAKVDSEAEKQYDDQIFKMKADATLTFAEQEAHTTKNKILAELDRIRGSEEGVYEVSKDEPEAVEEDDEEESTGFDPSSYSAPEGTGDLHFASE